MPAYLEVRGGEASLRIREENENLLRASWVLTNLTSFVKE